MTDDRSTIGAGADTSSTRLAHEIRRLRRAAGLSQVELARLVGYTRQYVSLAERASHNLPSQELTRSIDRALEANGSLISLRAHAKAEQRALRHGNADDEPTTPSLLDDPQHGALPRPATGHASLVGGQLRILRQVLDAHDLPEDGPVRSPEQLRQAVTDIVGMRLRSDYGALAVHVSPLLSEVLRAMATTQDSERIDTARLLVQVYRAADALADKFGYYDLSARIIGMLRDAAVQAQDELLLATAAYVRGETFFASGDLATGARMLERAAKRISPGSSPTSSATYGSLHMRAAVMSARAGRATDAADHIAEAHMVAQQVNEGIHLGTAFGAASVRIHRVSLAVELGDVGSALRHAAGWEPPSTLPAERRSHFYIELGRAYHQADRPYDALDALHTARLIAPEHVHPHPQVRDIIHQMTITGPGTSNTSLAEFDSWMALSSTVPK